MAAVGVFIARLCGKLKKDGVRAAAVLRLRPQCVGPLLAWLRTGCGWAGEGAEGGAAGWARGRRIAGKGLGFAVALCIYL